MDLSDLIEESPQSRVFMRRWWLDAVARDWEYIAVEKGGEVQAAMPVVYKGRNIVMPPLTYALGILFPPTRGSYARALSTRQRLTKEIIGKLPSFHRFRVQFNHDFTDWLPFYWSGFKQTTKYTYVMEDLRDLASAWDAMEKTMRGEIRRPKGELEVRDDLSISDFHGICRVTFDKMRRTYPRDVIDRVDRACRENEASTVLYAVTRKGGVESALYLVHDGYWAHYLLSGTAPDSEKGGGLSLLLWEGIKRVASHTASFDFTGSMLSAVERKFRRFGAVQKPYFLIWREDILARAKSRFRFLKPLGSALRK